MCPTVGVHFFNQALGGLHSAEIILVSVDFAEIEKYQSSGDWIAASKVLINAAKKLESSDADFILICTNTMHKVAHEVESAISIPLLHIAMATGEKLKIDRIDKVALLGTRFTMEQDFYKDVLRNAYQLDVIVPRDKNAGIVHRVIYQELCLGKCYSHSKQAYLSIIESLIEEGAQAIILGCTEIGLLIDQDDVSIPIYDTCLIHCSKAVELAIA